MSPIPAVYPPSLSSLSTAKAETIRTIVVDDYPGTVETVCALIDLEPLVEIVGRAGNGVDAIAAVASLRPELIIMDVNMPRLDGLTAAAILNRLYPGLRIILMSSENTAAVRRSGERHGADAFVPKQELIRQLPEILHELFPKKVV